MGCLVRQPDRSYNLAMSIQEIPLGELDQFQTLVAIVARLRAPGGCPWDREQTHTSLKRKLVEECYEVLEAIDDEDPQLLAEELGDLLVQVAFHADFAWEAGQFDLGDVLTRINQKLIVFRCSDAPCIESGSLELFNANSKKHIIIFRIFGMP